MINVTTLYDIIEFIEVHKHYVDLQNDSQVENVFKRFIENDRAVFKDEMSLKILKEIDGAKRVGEYGVRTPFGKSCITCLSTGCKFALLLWYYHDRDIPVFTNFERGGDNVWKFISENFDVSFYADYISYSRIVNMKIDLTIDGVLYTKDNLFDIFKLQQEKEEELFTITEEKEAKAYNKYFSGNNKIIYRLLKEEMSLKEFCNICNTDYFNQESLDKLPDLNVKNYCSALPDCFMFRKLPIWYVGKKSSKYECFNGLTVKYPSFLELFIFSIIDGYNDCGEMFRDKYDEFFALVLDYEERCEIKDYPENTILGVSFNKKEKQITIYDKRQAIKKFHEWYLMTLK